jgi:hypothetical protein
LGKRRRRKKPEGKQLAEEEAEDFSKTHSKT